MRVYIITVDDLIVSRETPTEPGENEIFVASLDELRAARLSGKRLLALWNGLSGADRLSKVGNREALLDRLWSALEALPDPQPARASKQAEVTAEIFAPPETRAPWRLSLVALNARPREVVANSPRSQG